jgi:hypothetical protein
MFRQHMMLSDNTSSDFGLQIGAQVIIMTDCIPTGNRKDSIDHWSDLQGAKYVHGKRTQATNFTCMYINVHDFPNSSAFLCLPSCGSSTKQQSCTCLYIK